MRVILLLGQDVSEAIEAGVTMISRVCCVIGVLGSGDRKRLLGLPRM